MGIRSRLRPLQEWVQFRFTRRSDLPVRYFADWPNVGDALNPYMLRAISGRRLFPVRSRAVPHVLGIGSILHLASPRSVVWGSGLISPQRKPASHVLKKLKVKALRGPATQQLLQAEGLQVADVPLGDPAVLMPRFYHPQRKPSAAGRFRLGVAPHKVDQSCPTARQLCAQPGVCLLDVAWPPQQFIDALLQCDQIVSSSLHGLILADAYEIPNVWVRFSGELLGGDFKFLDYYATTDQSAPECVDLGSSRDPLADLEPALAKARVSAYQGSFKALLDAFPHQCAG